MFHRTGQLLAIPKRRIEEILCLGIRVTVNERLRDCRDIETRRFYILWFCFFKSLSTSLFFQPCGRNGFRFSCSASRLQNLGSFWRDGHLCRLGVHTLPESAPPVPPWLPLYSGLP